MLPIDEVEWFFRNFNSISILNREYYTIKARNQFTSLVERCQTLERAFIDILDGNSAWNDIQTNTGLRETKCKEIAKLFDEIMKEQGHL
jgi:hypothetical protein